MPKPKLLISKKICDLQGQSKKTINMMVKYFTLDILAVFQLNSYFFFQVITSELNSNFKKYGILLQIN